MEDIVSNIIDLYQKHDWRGIVERYHDHPERNKVLWVFPNEQNFNFLKECMKDLGCEDILSIGCGSGLLEWLITAATDIPVRGIEVDSAWWRCKYAPPTFIPLLFTPFKLERETTSLLQNCSKTALLFCYFNDRPAFEEYLKYFGGNVLIIIGPDGKGIHTDPGPFGGVTDNWVIYKSEEVRTSRDFIVVYKRKLQNHIPF